MPPDITPPEQPKPPKVNTVTVLEVHLDLATGQFIVRRHPKNKITAIAMCELAKDWLIEEMKTPSQILRASGPIT